MVIKDGLIQGELKQSHKHTHICEDNKYTRQYQSGDQITQQTTCLICGFQLSTITLPNKGMFYEYLNPLLIDKS